MSTLSGKQSIKIAIADDHPIICDAIQSNFQKSDDFKISYVVNDGEELLSIINDLNTQVLILDLKLPKVNGIDCLKYVRNKFPNIKIVIFSGTSNSTQILECINLGVNSFVSKFMIGDDLLESVRNVLKSEYYFNNFVMDIVRAHHKHLLIQDPIFMKTGISFTKIEKQVISLTFNEHTVSDISEKLGLSKRTIEGHRHKIIKKIATRMECKSVIGISKFVMQFHLEEDCGEK